MFYIANLKTIVIALISFTNFNYYLFGTQEDDGNPGLIHKNLYSSVLRIYYQLGQKYPESKLLETNYKELLEKFKFNSDLDFKTTIGFLILLCPGQGKLENDDHILFCQCINDLLPCFYESENQEKPIVINLAFLKAAYELCMFRKHCQDYIIQVSKPEPGKPTKASSCQKTKHQVATSLLKFIRIFTAVIVISNDTKELPKNMIVIGSIIKQGVVTTFGAHKQFTDLLTILEGTLTFIGHNSAAISQVLGFIKMLCTLVI